jgi:hypothetical protein
VKENESSAEGGKSAKMAEQHEGKRKGKETHAAPDRIRHRKPFGFGYHLELNGKRILSGDQIPSNYTLQLKEFVSALRECRRPMASGEGMLKTQFLLDAARQSKREKMPGGKGAAAGEQAIAQISRAVYDFFLYQQAARAKIQ